LAAPDEELGLDALTEAAAAAMKRNKRTLEGLGYEVLEVPSLPPRFESGQVFYPSSLNALTLQSPTGGTMVLMPWYPRLDLKIQEQAKRRVETAFGAGTQVVPIDCSIVAPNQGGIHSLTSTVPRKISRFAKSGK
jgi:agmatine/peptidylarginine deiminase